jgi:hypothetical protein
MWHAFNGGVQCVTSSFGDEPRRMFTVNTETAVFDESLENLQNPTQLISEDLIYNITSSVNRLLDEVCKKSVLENVFM